MLITLYWGFGPPLNLTHFKESKGEQGHCYEELPYFESDIVGKVVRCIRIGVQSDDHKTQYRNQDELEQGILEVAEKILEFT